MENLFKYSDNNKRYHTYTYHLQQKFGGKVAKISLNGGFTCPNIDGTRGSGGCTYCSGAGSGEFAGNVRDSLIQQFYDVSVKMGEKWQNLQYIPYFQAFTNTYAPLDKLKELYETALTFERTVGLAIATRADCITEEIADYLGELSKRTYLSVELGLQSVHDETGVKINRCHTYEEFLTGFNMLKSRGINVCVHIINGLPNETHEMMVESVRTVSKLPIDSIKIHLLHILKNTQIEKEYSRGDFELLTREQYVNIVCDQLELLPPHVVVQRLTGDGKAEDLIGPMWSLKKLVVMNEIDKEFIRRGTMQGAKYYSDNSI